MRKILVSAYGCEPDKGSEAGVGWNWCIQMAKCNELWIITRANNKDVITGKIPKELEKNINFIYYDLPKTIKKIKNKEKRLYLYYFLWQLGAYFTAKKIIKEKEFDYCMHLTFGSMWMPTLFPLLKLPFIWGPIGGGESVPDYYLNNFPLKYRIVQKLRKLLITTSFINPLITIPSRNAELIIARTEESADVIPFKYRNKTRIILETAIDFDMFKENVRIRENEKICKIIYTGRLIHLKGLENALHALALIKAEGKICFEFTIIGKGPMKKSLIKLANDLGIEDNVKFVDQISQQEVIDHLYKSDIYLFPSLKEGGPWSLMEAMASGLPIVCMDLSGMHIITDETCAFRIKPSSPKTTQLDMAKALNTLMLDRKLQESMGDNARNRIQKEFNWDKKGVFIEAFLQRNKNKSLYNDL